ncbi:MAG TPA: hypothetical protein VLH37_05340 [Bacteroidales bacterium]|nr:hypothetical protein [Bacteroidales bacterium]
MVELEKRLVVKASLEELPKVEFFVEKICDQFNIFNSYFGNILFSVCEVFTLLASETDSSKKKIQLYFYADAKGLNFRVALKDRFFEIAGICQKTTEELLMGDDLTPTEKSLLSVNLLVDEMNFNSKNESVDLVFYISSIHMNAYKHRISLLDTYFEKINKTATV